jgi:hypothetical protein
MCPHCHLCVFRRFLECTLHYPDFGHAKAGGAAVDIRAFAARRTCGALRRAPGSVGIGAYGRLAAGAGAFRPFLATVALTATSGHTFTPNITAQSRGYVLIHLKSTPSCKCNIHPARRVATACQALRQEVVAQRPGCCPIYLSIPCMHHHGRGWDRVRSNAEPGCQT